MPSNFLSAGISGSLNYGPGFDRLLLGGLPIDGIASLNGLVFDESPTAFEINLKATPRNFAGLEVTIPEPSAALLVSAGVFGVFIGRRR